MVAADIVRGGLVLAVPFVALHSTTGVFALAFFTSCATVFFDPGMMALLPEIVPDDSLLRANSVLEASSHLTEIVGFAAAGVVVSYFAMKTTFTVDAATFGVSAVTLLAMTLKGSRRAAGSGDTDDAPPARPAFWEEVREGFSYLLHHAGLRANTLVTIAAVAGVGAFYPLTFFLAVDRFHGARTFGFMEATIAVGYLGGSVVMAAMAKRVRKGLAMTVGLMVMGGCYTVPWPSTPCRSSSPTSSCSAPPTRRC